MILSPIDAGLRGGALLLLALLAALILRDYGRSVAARLGAAFAAGTAAFVLCSAPGFHQALGVWSLPVQALAAGNNLVLWLFARSLFEDGFRPKPWQGLLWAGIVGTGLLNGTWLAHAPLNGPLSIALTLQAPVLAVLALGQTLATWRGDLVNRRRVLRQFVVGASAVFTLVQTVAQASGAGGAWLPAGVAAIAAGCAWLLLGASQAGAVFAEARPVRVRAKVPPDEGLMLGRIGRLMREERLYRQDGLTIGALAHRLGVPDYRVRQIINGELGHRNFAAFVNGYRIDEARAALADAEQAQVPVITIALDAGFASLGPFNRAFKAATGRTPTEYRQAALAETSKSVVPAG
ncbi:helix-turn-helix domain-containing protein [Asticcacaulis solisilvae]|uniref:helix-turn-helix domain-containing protein n=1 Tax=Asticcacaulis solisilvae TaxID=1217274 RepID=UPI003FD702F0